MGGSQQELPPVTVLAVQPQEKGTPFNFQRNLGHDGLWMRSMAIKYADMYSQRYAFSLHFLLIRRLVSVLILGFPGAMGFKLTSVVSNPNV